MTGDEVHIGFAAGTVLENVEGWSESLLHDRRPEWEFASDGLARKFAFREVSIEAGQQRLDLAEAVRVGSGNPGRFLREARWRAELVAAERLVSFRADNGL